MQQPIEVQATTDEQRVTPAMRTYLMAGIHDPEGRLPYGSRMVDGALDLEFIREVCARGRGIELARATGYTGFSHMRITAAGKRAAFATSQWDAMNAAHANGNQFPAGTSRSVLNYLERHGIAEVRDGGHYLTDDGLFALGKASVRDRKAAAEKAKLKAQSLAVAEATVSSRRQVEARRAGRVASAAAPIPAAPDVPSAPVADEVSDLVAEVERLRAFAAATKQRHEEIRTSIRIRKRYLNSEARDLVNGILWVLDRPHPTSAPADETALRSTTHTPYVFSVLSRRAAALVASAIAYPAYFDGSPTITVLLPGGASCGITATYDDNGCLDFEPQELARVLDRLAELLGSPHSDRVAITITEGPGTGWAWGVADDFRPLTPNGAERAMPGWFSAETTNRPLSDQPDVRVPAVLSERTADEFTRRGIASRR